MILTIDNLCLPIASDIDNIIFVRIPKTASTSMMTLKDKRWHHGCSRHIDHRVWKNWKTEKTFSFTVVRNPFEILCSRYHKILNHIQEEDSNKDIKFDTFIKTFCSSDIASLKKSLFVDVGSRGTSVYPISKTEPYNPADMWRVLGGLAENQNLARSQFYQIFSEKGVCDINVILKCEKIKEGVKAIFCDYLGKQKVTDKSIDRGGLSYPNRGFPHYNASLNKKKDYREYYTDETIELVQNHYKNDFTMFGYDFDGTTDDEIFIDPKAISIPPFDLESFRTPSGRGASSLWPVDPEKDKRYVNINGRKMKI